MENIYGILTLYTDGWSHRPVGNNKDILLKYSGLSSVYFPKEILIGNRATKENIFRINEGVPEYYYMPIPIWVDKNDISSGSAHGPYWDIELFKAEDDDSAILKYELRD